MRHYSFEECVRNIQRLNTKINAVTHLCLDEARAAHQVRKKEKPRSPLHGHLDKLFQTGELHLWEAISSVTSALTIGRWIQDRRLHPLTAQTLALLALGKMTIYRDARKYRDQVSELHHKVESLWRQGYILVTPTTTYSAPKHGKALLTWSLLNFVKFGNLIDATALAFPWGKFPNGLPRSLQLIGPPGSEHHLLDLAERLTQVAF